MSIDDYFAARPSVDREIYEAVAAVLADCDGVEVEAVSVGVLFRARRTFVELRPRRVGLVVSIVLPAALRSWRVTRRVPLGPGAMASFLPAKSAADIDGEVVGWLLESYEFCS